MLDGCVNAISKLPLLEPMLGVSIALCVAYLGLTRFRYRDKIRNHAQTEIERFNKNGNLPDAVSGTIVYKELSRLSNLSNNDSPKKWFVFRERTKLPSGWWPSIYRIFFEVHSDRFVCKFLGFLCALLLIVGVAHTASMYQQVKCLFNSENIAFSFYIVIAAGVFPPLFVWLGDGVVKWAHKFSTERAKDIEKILQQPVETVSLKENKANAE